MSKVVSAAPWTAPITNTAASVWSYVIAVIVSNVFKPFTTPFWVAPNKDSVWTLPSISVPVIVTVVSEPSAVLVSVIRTWIPFACELVAPEIRVADVDDTAVAATKLSVSTAPFEPSDPALVIETWLLKLVGDNIVIAPAAVISAAANKEAAAVVLPPTIPDWLTVPLISLKALMKSVSPWWITLMSTPEALVNLIAPSDMAEALTSPILAEFIAVTIPSRPVADVRSTLTLFT